MNKFVPPTLPYIEGVNYTKKNNRLKNQTKRTLESTNPKAKSSKKCSSLSKVTGGAKSVCLLPNWKKNFHPKPRPLCQK